MGDRWEGIKGTYTLEGQDGSVIQANISGTRIKHSDEDVASKVEGARLAKQQIESFKRRVTAIINKQLLFQVTGHFTSS